MAILAKPRTKAPISPLHMLVREGGSLEKGRGESGEGKGRDKVGQTSEV